MQHGQQGRSSIRLAEVIGSLSLATDLGTGMPMENALRTCLLAVHLGAALGLPEPELVDTYYGALLGVIGCTADAHEWAAMVGDEIAITRHFATIDYSQTTAALGVMFRHVGEGQPRLRRARMLAGVFTQGQRTWQEGARAHCEVADRLADRLGFGPAVRTALGHMFERWDGRGRPHKVKGKDIALPVRIVHVALDAQMFYQLDGAEAAVGVARQRTGAKYDPAIVDCFCRRAPSLLAQLDTESIWEAVLACEPGPRPCLSPEQLDTALRAMADFTDLKTPYLLGHSSGVADLAAAAARQCKLPAPDVVAVHRAGLLHDLGRVGISAGIWCKPGPLTRGEWERVRLHPYYTERVLSQSTDLAPLGALAALHHERLDGTGYHRGVAAAMLPPGARILSAADAYHAMTEPRPHRPALSPEAAAVEMRREVRVGWLDGEATNAVLAAAGHRVRPSRREWPAGLSEREVEVLRLVARGHSSREMSRTLSISEKTVGHHIQHIYDKIGVSTRAAATLFAMQHHLVASDGW